MLGLINPEIKPFGPAQINVSPTESGVTLSVRTFGAPEHIGELDVGTKTGNGFSITWVSAVSVEVPTYLTTVYQPVSAHDSIGFLFGF